MSVQYRLTGRLETGDLAELFRADRDDGSGVQPVVVKLFHPLTSDPAYATEIAETEKRLAGAFHSGIAHVIDLGLVRQRLAVVREDKGGFTLGQALQRLNTKEVLLAPPLALAYVLGLLDLVQLAHEQGVVHGALTPGNVLISAEGRPAVCDFGALVALEKSPALKKNFGGRGRGAYRAPELSRGEDVSIASDLYSIGAITYELLTLKEPSTGTATVSTRRGAVPPPSRVDRRLNGRVDPVVMRALDPSPGRRFKSCKEMGQALRDFLANNGGLPAKDDLKRFVGELFPKEVNIDHLGPVPFAEKFSLKEVNGVELPEADERSIVVSRRTAFSGGAVDHDAETSESLPQLDAVPPERPAEKTPATSRGYPPGMERTPTGKLEPGEVPGRDELSWDAPPAQAPVAKKAAPAAQGNVMKRVRVIEDFQAMEGGADAPQPLPNDTIKMPSKPVLDAARAPPPKPAPQPSPFESQPIPVDERVVEPNGRVRRRLTFERNIAATRRRQLQMLGLAIGIGLLGIAALLTFRPQTMLWLKPAPPPRPLPTVNPTRNEPKREVKPPKETPRTPVAPPESCYQPPARKGAGFVTVVTKRALRVEIDGDKVCQSSFDKVPVAPGRHKIVLVDLKTGSKEEQPVSVSAGAHTKVQGFLKEPR